MIALGINGLGEFAFDDALQMSRSLNFHIQQRNGNYCVSDDLVAYASVSDGEPAAPLAIRGSAALRGLLKVWANECDDEALRREALLIDYEL